MRGKLKTKDWGVVYAKETWYQQIMAGLASKPIVKQLSLVLASISDSSAFCYKQRNRERGNSFKAWDEEYIYLIYNRALYITEHAVQYDFPPL